MRKTLSLVVCFLVISLVLCACKSSDGLADRVQSENGETQSVIDSSKTVSVAVDTVPFDVNNYSTWFFAERTDLVTPEAAEKINGGYVSDHRGVYVEIKIS